MMKTQIEAGELMERIRREARRHERAAFPPNSGPANAGDTVSMPTVPVLDLARPDGFDLENLLALSGNMVERARGKITVPKSVPKWLRPLIRNQGGYNDIVLELLALARETNRLLMAENAQLILHCQRQAEWMQAAEHRFARLEKRLGELERQVGNAEAPLDL